jgi:flagellar L-ring protein precursor FlgH
MKKAIITLFLASYLYGAGINLFSDIVANNVGDLVTVLIVESTSARSENKLSSDKSEQRQLAGSASGVLDFIPSVGTDYKNKASFEGGGRTSKSGSVQTTVTAEVKEVTANGCLIIEGRKKVNMGEDESYVILSGIIRPKDLSRANTISNERIA